MRWKSILWLLAASGAHQALTGQDDIQKRDLKLDRPPNTAPAPSRPTVPRGYALVIGISKYKNLDPSQNLNYPESDAEAIYRVLISQQAGAFPPENVHLLKGSQATIANIRHELEVWLPSVAQPADRVVVYFAGHGLVDGERGYLAAWDVAQGKLDTTAYPMAALGDVLANKVKAHWKVLLTDACHSGKITPETTDESVDLQLKKMPRDFLTLTATTERESSYEDGALSTGFGVFTYFLVQAWKGYADVDPCDGVLTADELIEYVRNNVKDYVRAHVQQVPGQPLRTQTPTASGDYAPDMVLGVNQACIGAAPANLSMSGNAVIEANMDVDVYVDGAFVGKLSQGKTLRQPLSTGLHKVDGVKQGYETDHKEVMIAPGQDATVTLRIRYAKSIKKTALDLGAKGESLLNTHRSSLNLLRIEGLQGGQSQNDLKQARDLFTRALAEAHGTRDLDALVNAVTLQADKWQLRHAVLLRLLCGCFHEPFMRFLFDTRSPQQVVRSVVEMVLIEVIDLGLSQLPGDARTLRIVCRSSRDSLSGNRRCGCGMGRSRGCAPFPDCGPARGR